jgi:hypothetical protein
MTTSDNRARPACHSRRALTRADLARHVEGDYGSNVRPCGVVRRELLSRISRRRTRLSLGRVFLYCVKAAGFAGGGVVSGDNVEPPSD